MTVSEVYWIGGAALQMEEGAAPDGALARTALESAMKRCGVRPGWLNQVHWLVEEGLAVSELSALEGGCAAQLAWREQPMWGHYTLHAAARALITRECDLLALGGLGQDGCAVSLLAAPRAVLVRRP